ncbi:hypothetical protein LUX57_01775 [Actinomadura madurae]|uniref:hypothetical protein n=1 Tax=Actinomadura madurae TaxID=1993 RepID=UPI0020D25A73|nr:hypothetical protein [Actinomadura madurae]MCP9964079.1 hypothetical protein [Actinomadura madurae]
MTQSARDPGPDPYDDGHPPVRLIKATRPDEPGPADEEVLEGEIVNAPPRAQAAVAAVRETVTTVATHQHTKTAVRHVLYVAEGGSVLVKRLWDSRTTARFERMMRSAEASGDLEAALEWEARAAAFRRDRHIRRMDLLELPHPDLRCAPQGRRWDGCAAGRARDPPGDRRP